MISVICPAFNEAEVVEETIERIRKTMTQAGVEHEIIVVDDGSTDGTGEKAIRAGVQVITRPQNFGYGAALKAGILAAKYDWIAITDTDGTYPIEEFPRLISQTPKFDMVVGQRTGKWYRGAFLKFPARKAFQWISEFAVGRKIPDVNSGFRIFRKDIALKHFYRISSGFSFTTTLTLAAMLDGYSVLYMPIPYGKREGKSKVKIVRDTLRSSQIIVEAILEYNPTKLFLLLSMPCWLTGALFFLVGLLDRSLNLRLEGIICILAGWLIFGIGLGAVSVKNTIMRLIIRIEKDSRFH